MICGFPGSNEYKGFTADKYLKLKRLKSWEKKVLAIVVKSMATSGVDGFMVEIEASTIRGQQQSMSIIGLPDQAIKEAGERIQAAIESCGYDIPKDKSIISLAPGDKKKRGSHFDLGMIIALLFQTDQIAPRNLSE